MPATASARRSAKLLKLTPVRLALAVTGIVAGAYLFATAFSYELIRGQLVAGLDRRVLEIFTLLTVSADPDDPEDLINAIRTQIAAAKASHFALQLRDHSGNILATNMGAVDLPLGWSTVQPKLLGRRGDVPLRIYSAEASGDRITVGVGFDEVSTLRETLVSTMLWSSLVALVLALSGAVAIAARLRRRLGQIEATMTQVAEGDLAARLPLSRADDDIDHVSAQMNAALERLSALVDGMRQVSTDIAHDLRTPLNRLQLQLHTAAKAAAIQQPVQPLLEEALAESDAIAATFTALLRIAQIESGLRRERFAPLDLSALVSFIHDTYADVAEDAGQHLLLDLVSRGPGIIGDRDLMVQALVNLVENAIRHCPPGATITICLRAQDGMTILAVRDDGPGIPAEERPKVLRRLYRLERSRTTPGSGLGLSLVAAVAELHGASLILGDEDPGLRVEIRFPATG
ncbi:HAMP domain-containing histidine kinase [Thioclava sp. BHET1]|nr:HAMP domain-containing histidine kinase [Thioclava sp. BHET1]